MERGTKSKKAKMLCVPDLRRRPRPLYHAMGAHVGLVEARGGGVEEEEAAAAGEEEEEEEGGICYQKRTSEEGEEVQGVAYQ